MRLIGYHFGALFCHAGPLLMFLGLASVASEAPAADRIILRNATIITGKTVSAFDVDGVRLDDGTLIGWDDIEQARLAADQQPAFDRLLGELGDHLFRLRQRLRVGDYQDLAPHAEALYPRYAGRGSTTAYMVMQATMWSRIAHGRREAAVEPYLHCFQYLSALGRRPVVLPGERRLQFDRQTGMCPALAPVWFDAQAAREALPLVSRAAARLNPRPPGAYVYFATLALAAGDVPRAEQALAFVQADRGELGELREIVAAQREVLEGSPSLAVTGLTVRLDKLSPRNKPLALYWLGMAQLDASDPDVRRRGMLRLLRIAALHGNEQPELAAAALYRCARTLREMGDLRGSAALRSELLVRYGQTYFAARAQATSPDESPEETP